MKLATILADGKQAVAVVDVERACASLANTSDDMNGVIEGWTGTLPTKGDAVELAHLKLLAPIPRTRRNVFCIGKNYFDHAHEFARSGFDSSAKTAAQAVPKAPIVFTKVPESVIATRETVRYPHGVSSQVDYEAELAVVIGREGRGIPREDALSYVFGYTILNDVTARDLQSKHAQWLLGKSQDTFCPMGPWIVTADEIDAAKLAIRCWINDELRQDSNTSLLIFDLPTLISTISAGITLYPGDVIATGTPAGVGIGFDPPRFLAPGDRMVVEIEGIGRLENSIG